MLNLLILTFLFFAGISAPSKQNYTVNQKMSFVGQFIMTLYGSPYWNPGPIFTVPLPETIKNSNTSKIGFVPILGQLQTYSLSLLKISVTRTLIQANQIKFVVNTYDTALVKKITIKYLLYAKDSLSNSDFQIIQTNYYPGGSKISRSPGDFAYLYPSIPYPVNISNSFNIATMITGIHAAYNINNIYDISVSSTLHSSYSLKIMIQSKYTSEYTILYHLSLTVFIIASANTSPNYRFFQGTISASSGTSKILNATYEMSGINTLVGLSSFFLSYRPGISFAVAVDESNGIQISTADSFNNANILSFDFLVIESFYCDYKTPYFQQSSQLCYSECPGRTVQNNVTLSCQCLMNNRANNNSVCLTQPEIIYSSFKTAFIISTSILSSMIIILICIIIRQCRQMKAQKNPSQKNVRLRIPNSNVKIIEFTEKLQSVQESKLKPFDFFKKRNEIKRFKDVFQFSESQITTQNQINERSKSKKSASSVKSVLWVSVRDPIKNQKCCHCPSSKAQEAYALSYCEHRYNLKHLLQLIREKKACTLCKEKLKSQIKYYCRMCRRKYRLLNVGQQIDERQLESVCGDCL